MSAQDDELIERYREASAKDASRPGPQVRAAVRAHAQMLLDSKIADGDKSVTGSVPAVRRTAANASRWKISALGSVALVGLSAMLLLQFERGTPEEQDIAYGPPQAEVSGAAEQSEKPPVESIVPPSAASGATPKGSAILKEHTAERMDAPQANTVPNRAKARTMTPSVAESRAASASDDAAAPSGFPGAPSASVDAAVAPGAAPAPAPSSEMAQPVPAPAPAQHSRTAKAAPPSMERTAPPAADTNALNGNLAAPPANAEKSSASALEQALREAALAGRVVQVQNLARQGVALDSRDSAGRTALMLAAMNGHTRVVQTLLALGAATALVDAQGQNAAQQAKRRGHAHIAELIDAGS